MTTTSKFMVFCLLAFNCLSMFCLANKAQANIPSDVEENPFEANEKARKSKIFIIGATGKFGRYVVEASIKSKHYTVALVRLATIQTDTEKAALVQQFISEGVNIVYGDINIDHDVLVNTMKSVDVVISCVGGMRVPDQVNITSAIKEAGNIKRFFPSEYAIDVDRLHDPVEPAAALFASKVSIRRLVESEGIPHTFVVANGFAGRFWPNLAQVDPATLLPDITDVVAYGDGNSIIITTAEEDVATYVIKAADDPRTLNKILYLRPPANIISYNKFFALWEKKSGKTLVKTYIPEQELLQLIQVTSMPTNILLAVCYSVAIKNDYGNYAINRSFGVEATKLYPEVKYKTVGAYFNQLLSNDSFSVMSKKGEDTFSF